MRLSLVTGSKQFKGWFGNWQNHPENASKIVDANGVTVNINSAKAINSVVGHEITHVLEGTKNPTGDGGRKLRIGTISYRLRKSRAV